MVTVKGKGDNGKSGAERIDWTEEMVFEIVPNGVRSRYWKKKSTGAEQMTWHLRYDWKAKKSHYSWSDALTGKKENKTHGLEGKILPGDSLFWLLKGFPFEKGEGYRIEGLMIMTDGGSLGGALIHRGEETLKTAFGPIETYKVELKPTGAIGLIAPKMIAWYTKKAPHIWLRFDGRDDGLTKPRTKNVLLKYEPAGAIAP